jgi:hypothetical protein
MATKFVQMRSCQLTAADGLKEHNPVSRLHFCSWFRQSVQVGEFDPQLMFFPNVSRFSLRVEVNSQNSQYWSAENQGFIHKLLPCDEKNGVWCTMSARREISTISGKGLPECKQRVLHA